jgi:hypothetical protein
VSSGISSLKHRQKESPDPCQLFDDITPNDPAQIPPLTALARRLFAICPNSASCERLFSNYGQILTDKRTRLRPNRVADLAEIKMRIRDEQLPSIKTELQDQVARLVIEREAQRQRPLEPLSPPQEPTQPHILQPPPANETAPHRSTLNNSDPGTRILQQFRNSIQDLQDADSTDCEPLIADIADRKTLKELFDFRSSFWQRSKDQDTARSNLGHELEHMDLLTEDAPERENDDYDLDSTTSSVIAS